MGSSKVSIIGVQHNQLKYNNEGALCSVDSEVRFVLNNFSKTAVTKNVDCVVGQGPCDSLGNRLKTEAPAAVKQGRCGQFYAQIYILHTFLTFLLIMYIHYLLTNLIIL